MNVTCPECKNIIDLSSRTDLAVGHIVECPTCGITLGVTSVNDGAVEVEIEDEGK